MFDYLALREWQNLLFIVTNLISNNVIPEMTSRVAPVYPL